MGCMQVTGRYQGKTYLRKDTPMLKEHGLGVVFEVEGFEDGKEINVYVVPDKSILDNEVVSRIRKELYIFSEKVELKGYHFIEHGHFVEWVGQWDGCQESVLDLCDDEAQMMEWLPICEEKMEDWAELIHGTKEKVAVKMVK